MYPLRILLSLPWAPQRLHIPCCTGCPPMHSQPAPHDWEPLEAENQVLLQIPCSLIIDST